MKSASSVWEHSRFQEGLEKGCACFDRLLNYSTGNYFARSQDFSTETVVSWPQGPTHLTVWERRFNVQSARNGCLRGTPGSSFSAGTMCRCCPP